MKCVIQSKILDTLIDYSVPKLKYMGHSYCHFALIYSCSGKSFKIYSYGYNQLRKGKTIHAEVDAINNLPPLHKKNKKKLLKVSILVIRLTRGEKVLVDSKCCMKCCEAIYKIPALRGYTIDNVAYSNNEGDIEEHHPISLLCQEDYHLSVYYSRTNYKPKIRQSVLNNPDRKTQLFINKI